jgi:hypothetical protein
MAGRRESAPPLRAWLPRLPFGSTIRTERHWYDPRRPRRPRHDIGFTRWISSTDGIIPRIDETSDHDPLFITDSVHGRCRPEVVVQ